MPPYLHNQMGNNHSTNSWFFVTIQLPVSLRTSAHTGVAISRFLDVFRTFCGRKLWLLNSYLFCNGTYLCAFFYVLSGGSRHRLGRRSGRLWGIGAGISTGYRASPLSGHRGSFPRSMPPGLTADQRFMEFQKGLPHREAASSNRSRISRSSPGSRARHWFFSSSGTP